MPFINRGSCWIIPVAVSWAIIHNEGLPIDRETELVSYKDRGKGGTEPPPMPANSPRCSEEIDSDGE